MRKSFVVTAVAFGVTCLTSAFAHHGWGGYSEDLEKTFTITQLKLGNPHDRLIVTDSDGQEWNLLLAPPARNRRFGFSKESVNVGDVVDIIGEKHPKRREVKVHCINIDGVNIYTYRYDSGKSSLERQRNERKSC